MEAANYQIALQKRIEQQQRQRAKQAEKNADPEYRRQQREKQTETARRAAARQIERRKSPEWQAEQKRKADKRSKSALERMKEKKAADVKPTARKRAVASTRGLKGRTPTAVERLVMDALGQLPCIACLQHGKETPLISLHHIEGRTKPGAHMLQLPLCDCHHQHAAPATIRAEHPWLVPVHADGIVGGKAEFGKHNGTERQLMIKAYHLAGISYLLEATGYA